MTKIAASVIAVLIMSPAPAAAQEGPVGIAFVQAPEQGGGVCTGAAAEQAFSCAVEQCMESGARDEDCLRTNWCMPSGWSVDVFLQHQEGPHWHEVVCGLPSKAIAMAVAVHLCDRTERDYLIECAPVQFYDPGGKESMDR